MWIPELVLFRSSSRLEQEGGGGKAWKARWVGGGGGGGGGAGRMLQAITLKPSAHLEVEPQPVLRAESVLPYMDVILQSIV